MKEFNKAPFIFLGITALLGIFLYSVSEILLPFIAALLIGYILEPFVGALESKRVPRTLAVAIALTVMISVLWAFFMTVFPLIYNQIHLLAQMAVGHSGDIKVAVTKLLNNYDLPANLRDQVEKGVNDLGGHLFGIFGNFLTHLLQSGLAAVNLLSLIFITPIVLFYLLKDWRHMSQNAAGLLPNSFWKKYGMMMRDIDYTMASYIRGQLLACAIMATYYAVTLSFIGLSAAIGLGIIAGTLIFIPYIGAIFSCCLGLLMAAVQFGTMSGILTVLAIFLVGQFLEGNFIIPKFVGEKINVHPVWIMFALLSAGALFGFLGMMFALPLTGVLAVVIKFTISDYKKSSIYK